LNILILVVFLLFGFLSDSLPAGAGDIVIKGPVVTRFVVEKNIHPQSKTIEIGWWMKRKEGWHTYWDSPGDVGLPPTLEWDLPEGITFRSMLYAPPQLVKMFKVFAHGHRGETLFVCNFNVERDLHEDEELIFKAKSSWLACYTTCLPTHANMQISIPVKSKTEIDTEWDQHFQKFWREHPQKRKPVGCHNARHLFAPKRMGKKNMPLFVFHVLIILNCRLSVFLRTGVLFVLISFKFQSVFSGEMIKTYSRFQWNCPIGGIVIKRNYRGFFIAQMVGLKRPAIFMKLLCPFVEFYNWRLGNLHFL